MDPAQLAAAGLDLLDTHRFIIEAVAGYKQQALDAGFSEHAAEQFAIHLHANLMVQMAAAIS